jgi:hypothetical protein
MTTHIPEIDQALQTLRHAILGALSDIGEENALTLWGLSADTGLPRETLRGIIADLRSEGLVIYVRGLFADDGRPAGAGYAITAAGIAEITTATPMEAQP